MNRKDFEAVIGLEVHVQLSTRSKAFCSCPNSFGLPPNTAVCPVCLGFPGSLPVLNREAFRSAVKVALALNCRVQSEVKFDRKNYYYPDLPKNYQISQFDKPIAYNGYVDILTPLNKRVLIGRVHLEEDAGKLLHDIDKNSTAVDYNRSGTALLEIVTEPVLSSPDEAYSFLAELKAILRYLGVSDCNMEEGSLRCDANISVRKRGEDKLGVKSELKNMNSFKAVRLALEYEIERHLSEIENGKAIQQETMLWDASKGVTLSMRLKEESHDYRYFPEPDLVPFHIEASETDLLKHSLPELPQARRSRFMEQYGLDMKTVQSLIIDKDVADYFEEAAKVIPLAKKLANWVTGDIMSEINQKGITIREYPLKPRMLADLVALIEDGTISGKMAKDIFRECAEKNISPSELVRGKGLKQITDEDELDAVCESVISENEKSVTAYKAGKSNALMFLVGQVMKKTRGKANPALVNTLLAKKLS